MGKCIMPSNGIFARVLQEGEISVRDTIQVLPETGKEPFRAAVITLSDKGAAGEREDMSCFNSPYATFLRNFGANKI